MEISSIDDLNRLESVIKQVLKKIKLGDALKSLYIAKNNSSEIPPFMIAGFALFATRFCSPSKVSQGIKHYDIKNLIHWSNLYLLTDPITIDRQLEEELSKTLQQRLQSTF